MNDFMFLGKMEVKSVKTNIGTKSTQNGTRTDASLSTKSEAITSTQDFMKIFGTFV